MTTRTTLLALCAAALAVMFTPALAQAEEPKFEVSNFTATANNADGTLDTQAGDHPYSATTTFDLSGGDVKDTLVEIPAGFIGNPQATPQCAVGRLTDQENRCPSDTQVGIANLTLGTSSANYPVYNLAPEAGLPAEFGFALFGDSTPVFLYASVRTDGDYGVTVSSRGIVQGGYVTRVAVTFWGVPADASHDSQRGACSGNGTGSCSSGAPLDPFLTNPVDCSAGPLTTTLLADSWQHPGRVNADGTPDLSDPNWLQLHSVSPAVTGCERLLFDPSFALTPDTKQADAPTGDHPVEIKVPQSDLPSELATPQLRNLTFTAPAGVTLNPGAADGLQACTDAQFALGSSAPADCPGASRVGTVTVTTPLLREPLQGQVFAGTPGCGGAGQGPCSDADAADGTLVRAFIQLEGQGVLVKQLVHVSVDPGTGRITATVSDAPQQPFSDLALNFTGGPRALFINPLQCGAATASVQLTPWSSGGANGTPEATPLVEPFNVDWDGTGGACPASLPFTPGFLAQTSSPLAGAFSPFTVAFSRPDREQQLSTVTLKTPPGLLGMLSSVPLCGEPQAQTGTCGAPSRIATATVAAGTGPHPFYLSGPVYLTGPYRGRPFGLSVAVPAVAGPFNLGTVVVRAALAVDPNTGQITVLSDPVPQILDGIQTHIQSVEVAVDRPGFMFNPTNCSQQQVGGTIYSTQGTAAAVSTPFAAAGCAGLPFKPTLTASTAGRASKQAGASLTVKVISAAGQANIARVDLQIPRQLPARLTTLQQACSEAQFDTNPAGCPRASVIGTAKAVTPVLNVPLAGPAILVSHGGAAFPDVEFVLQGQGVTVVLDGRTDIKKGITYSRFETVPDAPISSFETVLPQGPDSILGANLPPNAHYDFCGQKLTIPTTIVGQNGAEIHQGVKVGVTGCPRAKKANTKKSAKAARHKHPRKTANANRSTTNRRAG